MFTLSIPARSHLATQQLVDIAVRNVIWARQHPRVVIAATANESSFGHKLQDATEKAARRLTTPTRKQHAEQSEKANKDRAERRKRIKGK
jgi:hypothetical protein